MIGVHSKASVNGLNAHNSPTDTLRLHLLQSLAGDTTLPATIDKIVLVDDTGAERDYASVSATSWSAPSPGSRRVTVSITTSASYTIAKIRVYAGTYLYFEGTLSTPQQAPAGSRVDVTFEFSLVYASGTAVTNEFLENLVKRLTTGEGKGVSVKYVRLLAGGAEVETISGTVTVDEANYRVVFTAEYTPPADVEIDEYAYLLSDYTVIARVLTGIVTLYAGTTNTWEYSIGL
jgi:hypothetical protein